MRTVRMTGNVAFGALPSILPTKGKHVTTVTAPIGTHVCERLETMGYTMVDFFFIVVLCTEVSGKRNKDDKHALRQR